MKEQEGLGDCLGHVDQVIVPPDVDQLVGQDRFDLRGGQIGECRNRQQDHRTEPANRGRCVDKRRLHDVDGHAQAEPGCDPFSGCLPARRIGRERSDL